MSSLAAKIKNNCYESVVKKLTKVTDDVHSFINADGDMSYYSKELDAVFSTRNAVEYFKSIQTDESLNKILV